jgi:hypothetical protein
MYFLLTLGLVLIVIGLAITSLAFVIRWKTGQINRSWHKDANIFQFLSLLAYC